MFWGKAANFFQQVYLFSINARDDFRDRAIGEYLFSVFIHNNFQLLFFYDIHLHTG